MVSPKRESSLELYRIIVMLAIVAHHYVVNSGLMTCVSGGGGMTCSKLFLLCFGAWGKIGINCFMLITGYFMCTGNIKMGKFVALLAQVLFYKYAIGIIFFVTGYEALTIMSVAKVLLPFRTISDGFTCCYLLFFLTIPFLNVLVNNITKRQHEVLLILAVGVYSIIPTLPFFSVRFNYIEWFVVLYFVSSYLRKYPNRRTEDRALWIFLSCLALLLCEFSVLLPMLATGRGSYYFVADVNKFPALVVSVCLFLAFKPSQFCSGNCYLSGRVTPGTKVFYSPLINAVAATTFGVFLIHANSDAMRRWLWQDVCKCVDFYYRADSVWLVVTHAVACVFAVFLVCSMIEYCRQMVLKNYGIDKVAMIVSRRLRNGCARIVRDLL